MAFAAPAKTAWPCLERRFGKRRAYALEWVRTLIARHLGPQGGPPREPGIRRLGARAHRKLTRRACTASSRDVESGRVSNAWIIGARRSLVRWEPTCVARDSAR